MKPIKMFVAFCLMLSATAFLSLPAWADPPVWEANIGPGLNQSDDDCDLINLGFTFNFYGVPYNQVWVNSNGNMTFNGCNTAWWHPDIPDGANVLIGPLYGDFNPAVAGDVHTNTLGAAPNRTFVATWNVVPEFLSPPLAINTFQSILFEGSDAILFGYNGLSTDGINWAFSPPSVDANMDVGITSGGGLFINTASGPAIPALDMTNVCYVPDGSGDYTEIPGPCMLPIDMDIKFCSSPNAFNCTRASGKVPLTIFGSDQVPVSDIEILSLRLCLASDPTICTGAPESWSVADRGDPSTDIGADSCAIDEETGEELDTLNPDGLDDLDVAFSAEDVAALIGCVDLAAGEASESLVVTGLTTGGIPIESMPVGGVGVDQLVATPVGGGKH